jgi:hypothetical protein
MGKYLPIAGIALCQNYGENSDKFLEMQGKFAPWTGFTDMLAPFLL